MSKNNFQLTSRLYYKNYT